MSHENGSLTPKGARSLTVVPLSQLTSHSYGSLRTANRSSAPLLRDAGDSFGGATNLGRLRLGDQRRRSGKVDRNDSDFYRVTLLERADIVANVTNKEVRDRETLTAAIFDGKRKQLTSKLIQPGKSFRLFVNDAKSGTYFIRLITKGNNVDFSLRLTLGQP